MISGSVVYLFAFDVANEIRTGEVREVLSARPAQLQLRTATALPKDVRIHQPLVIGGPPETVVMGGAPRSLSCFVKVFEVGALSITYELPVEVTALADLVAFHDLQVGDRLLADRAEALCDRVTGELRPTMAGPPRERSPAEAYTVFCLRAVDGVAAAELGAWAVAARADIAALLAQEPPDRLADEQVAETTRLWRRYSKGDLAVIDWDAALLVDLGGKFDDVLYVIELANLQLEQFRNLDDRLDAVALQAYGDLERHYRGRAGVRVPARILADLRSSRVDLTKMSEEVDNITKFVGDWYLAHLSAACRERFHLDHWQKSVASKIEELDDLYSLVRSEIEARRMLLLEVIIVALFVLDVVLLIWKG